jgi:brefeldin A-inhibited guanine nucleotide-exchange protein
MRNRIFSLELLYLIIENAGPVLRNHERFVTQGIKKYLSMSLLANGVSPVQQVFKFSLDIFYALILNFKDHLKVSLSLSLSLSGSLARSLAV